MDTDNLIISRIGELQRKMTLLSQFNREMTSSRKANKWIFRSLAGAACIALVLTVTFGIINHKGSKGLLLPEPSFIEYRGGSANLIQASIQDEKYGRALNLIELSILQSEDEIHSLSMAGDDSEEASYLISLEKESLEELYWARIYVAYKLDDKKLLRNSCVAYLEDPYNQNYRSEVREIVKEINKK